MLSLFFSCIPLVLLLSMPKESSVLLRLRLGIRGLPSWRLALLALRLAFCFFCRHPWAAASCVIHLGQIAPFLMAPRAEWNAQTAAIREGGGGGATATDAGGSRVFACGIVLRFSLLMLVASRHTWRSTRRPSSLAALLCDTARSDTGPFARAPDVFWSAQVSGHTVPFP
jgi:hypothetical protein